MSVGLAVFYGGVDGLSDTCEGSGEIADVICELDGWDRKVLKFWGGGGGVQPVLKVKIRSSIKD